MADIAGRSVLVPRVPWRALVTALLIVALVLAAALVVGSRQTRLPPAFGLARNGLVAYSVYGDIHTVDVRTGATAPVVTGQALDSHPLFSRDGTLLAFLRASGTGHYDLMVANADGTGARPVPGTPIQGIDDEHDFDVEWAADSRSLIVYVEPMILRVDAVGSAAPAVISADAVPTGRLGPDGLIPYQPVSIAEDALWVVSTDGGAGTEIIRRSAAESGIGGLSSVRFSPDGSKVAFHQQVPGADHEWRIFVANADGTAVRRLTDATGMGEENGFEWSPDSTRIAFNRWNPVDEANPDGDWHPQPIGVVTVGDSEGGSPVNAIGPSLGAQGADYEWSPDGTAVIALPSKAQQSTRLVKPLLIDATTGEARTLDVRTIEVTSWQRLAP
jgi:dipeptidyl aminopeptidase/acylaminoacyl peptidase